MTVSLVESVMPAVVIICHPANVIELLNIATPKQTL